MSKVLYFVGGALVCFLILVVIGVSEMDEKCRNAGGVPAGETCVDPNSVIGVK